MDKINIENKEEELRIAMLNSDIEKLDSLIDESLIFTIPSGEIINKSLDLKAHQSGDQKINALECVESNIQVFPSFSVVATKMKLLGEYKGNKIDGLYSYTRVWTVIGSEYKVVAGQVAFVGGIGAG